MPPERDVVAAFAQQAKLNVAAEIVNFRFLLRYFQKRPDMLALPHGLAVFDGLSGLAENVMELVYGVEVRADAAQSFMIV
jgi:hypothetical protein